jgi:hypothetical protein
MKEHWGLVSVSGNRNRKQENVTLQPDVSNKTRSRAKNNFISSLKEQTSLPTDPPLCPLLCNIPQVTFVLLYEARMIADGECGAAGGMSDGGTRSTGRKPASIPLCPWQISYGRNWAQNRPTGVGSQRLIA